MNDALGVDEGDCLQEVEVGDNSAASLLLV